MTELLPTRLVRKACRLVPEVSRQVLLEMAKRCGPAGEGVSGRQEAAAPKGV